MILLTPADERETIREREKKFLICRGGYIHLEKLTIEAVKGFFRFNHARFFQIIYWANGEEITVSAKKFLKETK